MSALATIALGALAEQAGVDVATVRAYERLGLISKSRRAIGGLQLYRVADITRVTFIRRTQELGFSLRT
ncbi:MAG: MerR family transcriptional regulator, partial [Reyranella sp.]|nr:MerR family transcriptional regulator [Reyranella sp.]